MAFLSPADAAWPEQAKLEIARWRAALGSTLIDCYHIGSTSVPDLMAKPVLDLLPVVTSVTDLDATSHVITALGYEAMGEFSLPGRRYFRKNAPDGTRMFQAHAYAIGDPSVRRHLAFRDLLRNNPTVRDAYQTVKVNADKTARGDIERYIALKNDFIKTHEAIALQIPTEH